MRPLLGMALVLLLVGCQGGAGPEQVDVSELDAPPPPAEARQQGAAPAGRRPVVPPEIEPAPAAGQEGAEAAEPAQTVRAGSPRELIELVAHSVDRGHLATIAALIDDSNPAGLAAIETHLLMDRIVHNGRVLRQEVHRRFGPVESEQVRRAVLESSMTDGPIAALAAGVVDLETRLRRVALELKMTDGPIAALAAGVANFDIRRQGDEAVLTPEARYDRPIHLIQRDGAWLIDFSNLPEQELPDEAAFAQMRRMEQLSAELVELVGMSESFEQFARIAEERIMNTLMEHAP